MNRTPVPAEVREAVFGRDGRRCVECESVKRLQLDHIVPRSADGPNDPSNLQVLCGPCNGAKGGIQQHRIYCAKVACGRRVVEGYCRSHERDADRWDAERTIHELAPLLQQRWGMELVQQATAEAVRRAYEGDAAVVEGEQ